MGGGATMRAAASKVAGLGVHGGLRGVAPAAAPVEQAVRKSSIPVSAILSSSRVAADASPVQRPASELDGWEFAGGEEDLVMAAGEPMPRVVFAGVPSIDEAKEATAELKEALDKVYLSSSESRELAICDNLSGLSLISKRDPEKSHLVVDSAPKYAIKAFKLLSSSTEAQNVVASIASDPKVWNAVMQNPVLQEFLESNQKTAVFEDSVPEKSEDCSKGRPKGNWFTGMLGNVVDMVSNLSSKLQNIFGFSSDAKESYADGHVIGIGTSLLGLATMVVMVVLFKRI